MQVRHETGAVIGDVERLDGALNKMKGLMFRNEGRVLLAFNHDGYHGVWMLFMRFSIDIAFIDGEKEVVGRERAVPPVSLHPGTWKVYRPPRPCRYVLEVEAGLLDENDIAVGDTVAFEP